MKITIQTLTPLWTGGAGQTCDRLHETGLIGSLRWWYEALVRGLGGYACDPTEQTCIYDTDKSHNGLCLGCQTFGATGWSRRFRLDVVDKTQSLGQGGKMQPNGNRFKRNSTTDRPSWYFSGPGRGGEFELKITPTAKNFDPIIVLGLLKLIEQHAGLGAKTQLGCGWICSKEEPTFDKNLFVQTIKSIAEGQPDNNKLGLPDLCKMFFAQVKTSDNKITATLNLRYDVRAAFRNAFGGNAELRHWLCGDVRGNERQSSKIFFSQAVNGAMRIWGWVPNDVPAQIGRDDVLGKIKETTEKFGAVESWREFDSPRDTVKRERDDVAFLTGLLR